jgi:hypothetical protein
MAALSGCASAPSILRGDTPVPTADYRAIAIVPVVGAAKADLAGINRVDPQDYADAGLRGLGMGALTGVAVGSGLMPYALAAGPGGWVAIPFIFAGAAAVGFVGGYLQGTAGIGPSPQAAALEATMTSAASSAALPDVAANTIAGAITKWTPYRAQVFASAAAVGMPAANRERPPGTEGFDGVLQIAITQFGYAARSAGKDVAVYVIAEARLLDAGTGQPVALRGMAYMSPWHGAELWTKADGALTRTELARASRALAERTVEHLFLHTPWHARAGQAACDIVPIASPGAAARVVPGAQAPVRVDGVQPLLGWSAPTALAPNTGAAAAAAEDPRYDLRIFEEYDWGPGDLVYEREGLRGNEHRVESTLKPATMYFWTVRARYAVDGQPRATRWSATGEVASLDPLPSQAVYATRLAQGAATHFACAAPQELTPCGCLDFIPAANWFRFRTP